MHVSPEVAIYPMGTVVKLTGVEAAKLRFWEAKYGLILPARDPMGRRLYSKNDVKRIRHITALLAHGLNLLVVSGMLEAEEQRELQRV